MCVSYTLLRHLNIKWNIKKSNWIFVENEFKQEQFKGSRCNNHKFLCDLILPSEALEVDYEQYKMERKLLLVGVSQIS